MSDLAMSGYKVEQPTSWFMTSSGSVYIGYKNNVYDLENVT